MPADRRRAIGLAALLAMLAAAPLDAQQQADSVRRAVPAFGAGLIWIAPLPLSPQEIARLLAGRTQEALTDSAIASLTQKYIDAMAEEMRNAPPAIPSWTTKIGGQEVGVDSRWIHLGPLKIPTFLLAMLPINVQANPTEAAMARKLDMMRRDLLTAGRRAANLEEFKRAVKALREQKEAERDFERNRRTPPSDSLEHR